MASSSTPSSSITTPPKKHEVFLSFRGEDTRQGFTSHLYDALCQKQIKTFIDYELERGDEISPALLRAIEESKIAVVIFSENYASSRWCLRELAEIIKCKKMNKLIVMPVFYDVDPSNVRKQTGSFESSFANYEEIGRVGIFSWFSRLLDRFKKRKEKELQEEVQKWREALTEASDLSGWASSVIRTESKLVGDIVEAVWRKLMNEYISASSDFEGLVGIHKRIEHVMSLLCLEIEDVRIIGIWGMGGIGKTTIARAVFKFISNKFDGACFIENIGKRLLENDGSDRLQREVLSEVLHEENLKLGAPTIRPFFMEMFNQKKVFIVLDDVNDFLQSETLVECLRRCGLGSRIIITSRDKQVLCNFKVNDHGIYEEKGLDHDDALELFHKYANPTEACMALSGKVFKYAKGNPLALKVLGSSLKGKSKSAWESALDSLQGTVNSKIFDVLKISYDGLEKKEQSLFLDIACFNNLYHKGILKILDEYSLSVLIAKSLVTLMKDWVNMEERVEMHDLLQDMGREIVCRESLKNPGKRSRLWQRDVIQILKNNTGTDAVEVISLDMNNRDSLEDIDLSSQFFDKMHNLRFLFLGYNKVHLPDGLNCLPDELRILSWHRYPLRVLPSNFNPKELVKLDLFYSNIEQLWDVTKPAPKLKWLFLKRCIHLTRIPDLSYFPLLVEVDRSYCRRLVDFPSSVQQHNSLRNLNLHVTKIEEVPSSIQSLTNLSELHLSGCRRLKHISTSICKLKSLSTLDLKDCSQLETFPEILETIESLKSLDLSGSAIKVLPPSIEHLNGLRRLTLSKSAIKVLPPSIEHLNGLRRLKLSNCKNLEMLLSSICNLKSLEYLCLSYCSKLDKLPDNLGNLKSLKRLQVQGSAVGQLPSSITCLENLEDLDCSGCSLMKIPEDIDCLFSLKKLKLSGNMFESLPKSIKQFSKLETLSLSHCNMLRSLPEFPKGLQCLEAKDCEQLCQVPDASEFVRCINSKDHHSSYYHPVQFIFANSLNLKAAVSNVFEESLRLMQRIKKESGKPSNQFCIYLPGNEIPEWFSGRSVESSVKIRVLRNDLVNRKFMGFAICAVLRVDKYNSRCVRFYPLHHFHGNVKIFLDHIEIANDRTYFPLNSINGPNMFIDTEHLLLGYCPFYSSSQDPKKLPDNDYLNILIEFGYECGCNGPKHCAVHPIYAEEPLEIIGATIQEIVETSGRRSDRSDENDEEVEPHPKRICTQAINTP